MIVLLLVAIAILYLLFRPELKGTFEMTSEQVDWDKGKDDAWRPVFEYRGNDSNLLIVFYVQIMPDDLVMQLHRF